MTTFFARLIPQDLFRTEKQSISYLSLMAALILMSYGLARGPSEALFMSEFSHTLLPGLWIEIGLGVICIVALYNYLLRFLSLKMMFMMSAAVTGISLLGILYGQWGGESRVIEIGGVQFPLGHVALLRLWCDLYIVVFVETYWSIANRRFPLKKATHIYGFLCAAGTIGSIFANTWVASKSLTPQNYIMMSFWSLPLLMTCNHLLSLNPTQQTKTDHELRANPKSGLFEGLKLIKRSRYLIWILGLVLLAQITVALIDYEYKRMLREAYLIYPERLRLQELTDALQNSDWSLVLGSLPTLDSITSEIQQLGILLQPALEEAHLFYQQSSANMAGFQGWMYLSIDAGALLSQVCTGWFIMRFGIIGTHLSIPLFLLTVMLSVWVWPTLILVATARSAAKFLTYSIFKTAKELLYVPLSYDEQTQGKAVIDIMVYRQAKIMASILLLPAVGIVAVGVHSLAMIALVLWILIVWRLRSLVS